jgi:hypothetical protein
MLCIITVISRKKELNVMISTGGSTSALNRALDIVLCTTERLVVYHQSSPVLNVHSRIFHGLDVVDTEI